MILLCWQYPHYWLCRVIYQAFLKINRSFILIGLGRKEKLAGLGVPSVGFFFFFLFFYFRSWKNFKTPALKSLKHFEETVSRGQLEVHENIKNCVTSLQNGRKEIFPVTKFSKRNSKFSVPDLYLSAFFRHWVPHAEDFVTYVWYHTGFRRDSVSLFPCPVQIEPPSPWSPHQLAVSP